MYLDVQQKNEKVRVISLVAVNSHLVDAHLDIIERPSPLPTHEVQVTNPFTTMSMSVQPLLITLIVD